MNRTIPAALLALVLGSPANGQNVVGRVVDAASGEPVPQAQVTVISGEQRPVGRALADASGRFAIELRSAGGFRLRAERTGYQPTLTGVLEVGPRDTVEVD